MSENLLYRHRLMMQPPVDKRRYLRYTTTDNGILTNVSYFNSNPVVRHEYKNGVGIIVFKNPVISISGFNGQVRLKSIHFNEGIITVENETFRGCTSLEEFNIPNTLTTLGGFAFAYNQLSYIVIPSNVTTLGKSAFFSKKSNLHIVCQSTELVQKATGTGWDNAVKVTIDCKPEYIGASSFYRCTLLKEVVIPEGVTSIGNRAFCMCTSLTTYTIPNTVSLIDTYAFANTKNPHVVIPPSVTTINSDAFSGCTDLNIECNNTYLLERNAKSNFGPVITVYIPVRPSKIGNSVFSVCSKLKTINIPDSVTSIGDSAFYKCSALTSITIPNSVTSIGDYAFIGCSSLTSIILPNSVTSIGRGVFGGCSSLTSITIPNSVTSIGVDAFEVCSSLTSITIPNSVTSIGKNAFSGCSALTSIVVESGNIVYDSRENCNAIIVTAANTLIAGCQSTTIPNSVTIIGAYAFRNQSKLTSITIPNSVTGCGSDVFIGCSSLTKTNYTGDLASWCSINFTTTLSNPTYISHNLYINDVEVKDLVTLTETVTSIRNYAFINCTLITSVTIPDSVTSIGQYAFSGCTGLTSVTTYITSPLSINSNVFNGVTLSNVILYVPQGCIEAYSTANVWSAFGSILEIPQ